MSGRRSDLDEQLFMKCVEFNFEASWHADCAKYLWATYCKVMFTHFEWPPTPGTAAGG